MARRAYTDKFRASAVLMWEANPNFVEVAKHLKMPEATLRSWVNRKRELDKQPSNSALDVEVYETTKDQFVQFIESEIKAIHSEMDIKRQDANYRDLGIVWGILTDKKQLLTGGPTSNQNQQVVIRYDE